MAKINFPNDDVPDDVLEDVRVLRQRVNCDLIRIEDGPDEKWTLRVQGDTDPQAFENIADMVERIVSSDDVRRFYEYRGKPYWSIQVRY